MCDPQIAGPGVWVGAADQGRQGFGSLFPGGHGSLAGRTGGVTWVSDGAPPGRHPDEDGCDPGLLPDQDVDEPGPLSPGRQPGGRVVSGTPTAAIGRVGGLSPGTGTPREPP